MRIPRVSCLVLLVAATACKPSAQPEPSVAPSDAPAGVAAEQESPRSPRYRSMGASATLYADPSVSAPHLELTPGRSASTQRLVELLEQREGWSRIRSVLPRQVMALGLDASMGLGVLELEGWVESSTLRELEPGEGAGQAAAEQAGAAGPNEQLLVQISVQGGTVLRWPDGRVAGKAVQSHHFRLPATRRESPGPNGPLVLDCHQQRSAPELGVINGWLCSEAMDVVADGTALGVALDQGIAFKTGDPTTGIKGALDRDVIRKVVRAHLDEVRDCYNVGLSTNPTLEGRVAINFVISGDGSVSSAMVQDDNLSDPTVAPCIAKAAQTWLFPKPRGGGNVIVTYPFNLTPE